MRDYAPELLKSVCTLQATGSHDYSLTFCKKMENSLIAKVEILPNKCLGVFPVAKSSSYHHIYREASGVYWDNETGCFKSTEIKEWSYAKWYIYILTVVKSGLGVNLEMTSKTELTL